MENPSSSSSYAAFTEAEAAAAAATAGGERKGSKKMSKKKNTNSSSSRKKGERSREGLKKGPWTAEEDEMLSNYINKQGIGRWRTLPLRAGLQRCGKSCRLRWMNYLRPNVKRGHISPAEEDIILRLHRLLGNRWSLIAGRIPGRTDNEIKNYWNTHLSKKLLSQGIDPRTHKPLSPPLPTLKPPILNPSPPIPPTSPPLNPNTHLFKSAIVCPNCHSTPSASVSDTNSSVPHDTHPLSFTNLMPNDDHDSTINQLQNPNDPESEFILNHCNFGEDDDNLVFSSFFNSLIDHVDISPPIPDALLSPQNTYFLPHTASQGPEDLGTDVFITIPSPSL